MNNPDITLYGIPNCDTVKSPAHGSQPGDAAITFTISSNRASPPTLARWMTQAGWETLLNRKGTTWRKLDATTQAGIHDAASASALMQAQPSIIKRPVVEWRSGSAVHVTVGFSETAWQECLKNHPSVG